jgi:hypothetical protein
MRKAADRIWRLGAEVEKIIQAASDPEKFALPGTNGY